MKEEGEEEEEEEEEEGFGMVGCLYWEEGCGMGIA